MIGYWIFYIRFSASCPNLLHFADLDPAALLGAGEDGVEDFLAAQAVLEVGLERFFGGDRAAKVARLLMKPCS